MTSIPDQCGTRSGYDRHRRRKEEPCEACRAACAAYMQQYRGSSTAARRREQAAHERALWALAARHPDEFRQLCAEETARDSEPVNRQVAVG